MLPLWHLNLTSTSFMNMSLTHCVMTPLWPFMSDLCLVTFDPHLVMSILCSVINTHCVMTPLWPFKRKRPDSLTTSHTITSVSYIMKIWGRKMGLNHPTFHESLTLKGIRWDRRWSPPSIRIFPTHADFVYINAFLIMKLSKLPSFRVIRALIASQSTFEK